jgi:hypothetical protein
MDISYLIAIIYAIIYFMLTITITIKVAQDNIIICAIYKKGKFTNKDEILIAEGNESQKLLI